jgi:hypothetical protein
MPAWARRSRSDRVRAPSKDAVKHRRSMPRISSAIAGWLLVKIRLGSLPGEGNLPIETVTALNAKAAKAPALIVPPSMARLRAHAAQRFVRRARRIPSRCYRAEPQDPGAPSPRATGCPTFRVGCVTASKDRETSKGKDCPFSSRTRSQVEYVASTGARSKTPTFSIASTRSGPP